MATLSQPIVRKIPPTGVMGPSTRFHCGFKASKYSDPENNVTPIASNAVAVRWCLDASAAIAAAWSIFNHKHVDT